jgi:CHASE2 domain-containing sensor protein
MDEIHIRTVLTVLYGLSGSVVIAAYVSQVLSAWADRRGARAVSMMAWVAWCSEAVIEFSYALVVARDTAFSLVSFGHLLGCLGVLVVAMLRRRQYRKSLTPAPAVAFDLEASPCVPVTDGYGGDL